MPKDIKGMIISPKGSAAARYLNRTASTGLKTCLLCSAVSMIH